MKISAFPSKGVVVAALTVKSSLPLERSLVLRPEGLLCPSVCGSVLPAPLWSEDTLPSTPLVPITSLAQLLSKLQWPQTPRPFCGPI